MIGRTRLAAALAFGVGLTVAGAALAQTQGGGAAPAADPAQPALPPSQSTTTWVPDSNQPVYTVPPPAGSSSDPDIPGVVGGYARSVAGCVLIGCDDGPVDPSLPSSPLPDQPQPPINPRPSDPQ